MKVCSVCQRCYDDSAAFCVDDNHPALSETRVSDRQMISGYRLDSLLDSGAGNETYRAHQIESGKTCLIRIVPATESTDHFLSEAKLAAAFFHPNVVDVFETGTLESGEMFAVFEHADGRTLRQFQDDVGAPDLLTSINIVRQAAEALHAMHLAGMTHRAVRPENIILTKDTNGGLLVRIQNPDLGGVAERTIIANKFLIDSHLDALRYFSPEQCSGDGACPQSDVYSLGIVFYEMLAGGPPFDATTAVGLIHKQRNEAPPDLKINNFELRMLVTHSVTEALHKQPRLRQPSANTLTRQLRHIEQLATHASTPPPAGAVVAPPRVVSTPAVVYAPRVAAPVPVQAARSEVVESRPEQIAAAEIAPEPVISMNAETESVLERPASPDASVQPVVMAPPAHESVRVLGRSLLNVWRKKLHSVALRMEAKPVSIVETSTEVPRQVSAAISQTEITEAPVPVEPRKIELELREDMPSVPAVQEVLASASAADPVEVASTEETIATPAVVEPPVVIEVAAVQLAKPEAIETPVIIEPPMLVEAEEKVVMEEPIAMQTIEETIDSPVVVAAPVAVELLKEEVQIPDPVKPARVQAPQVFIPRLKQRKKDPTPALVGASANPAKRISTGLDAPVPRNAPKKSGLGFRVNRADLEEITLVRPPAKRIQIDWDRVVASRDLSSILSVQKLPPPKEVEFHPTILGDTVTPKYAQPEQREGMFSAFESVSGSRVTSRNRSVMLGVGFMALVGFLLFGNDSITRYFQTWSSADSITPQMAKEAERPPAVTRTTVTAKKSVAKKAEAERAPRAADKPQPATQLNVKAVVAKARATTPATDRSRSKPDSVKRSPDKIPSTKQRTPTGSTRPRVVPSGQ